MAIKQDGTKVIVEYDSEAQARNARAEFESRAVDDDGFIGAMRRFYKTFDDLADMQPAMGWVSLCLLALGAVLEYISWSNLAIGKGLPFVLGSIGVAFYVMTKLAAGRWAVAVNNRQKARSTMFGRVTIVGAIICALIASQLMASQIVNEDQGAKQVYATIETLETDVSDLRRKIRMKESEGMTQKTVEEIQFEIQVLENEPALNSQGKKTGKTVGEEVGDCIGSSYYMDTYCDDIIAWKRKLLQREPYEIALAELAAKEAELSQARLSLPKTSGLSAIGRIFGRDIDNDALWKMAFGSLLMALIASAMIASTFLSKWNPPEDWEADK